MEMIELIDGFLKEQDLVWNRKVYGPVMDGPFPVVEEDFITFDTVRYIPLKIKNDATGFILKVGVVIDALNFKIIDFKLDNAKAIILKEKHPNILTKKDLSIEWQKYCAKEKGLVYKTLVEREINRAKHYTQVMIEDRIKSHMEEIVKLNQIKMFKLKSYDEILECVSNIVDSNN